jgi:multidrug resistance efflux pump
MLDLATERAEFTESIERRIDGLIRQFQEMELEEMRKGEVKARAKLAEAKKTFDQKRRHARESLSEARSASVAAWEEAKAGLQTAWTDLDRAVERAREEFAAETRAN